MRKRKLQKGSYWKDGLFHFMADNPIQMPIQQPNISPNGPQLTPNQNSSLTFEDTPNTPNTSYLPDDQKTFEDSYAKILAGKMAMQAKGLSTNPFKSTGNEGNDSNPMNRGPVDTGPEKTPEKPKYNPFLLMRGVSTAASFLSNAVARKAQNNYDYSEQTALGQMNPIPVDQFQPTYNNMYAQQGGMMNPFSIYARYGGNLKSIIKDYNKFSNNAQMDMGDGKVDDQGVMAKGGTYNLPDEYAHDMLRELLHMGRMGHQNYGKGTKPMRGKMQGGGDISSLVPNKSRIKEQYLLNEQEKRKAELAKYAGREVVQATPTLTPYEQKLHDVQRLQRNAEFVLHNSDYTMNQFGDLGKSDKYYFNQSPTGKMVNRIPHVLKGMLDASIVADAPGLLYKGLKYGIGKLGQGASKVGIDELGMFTKQGDKQIYELNNGFGDLNNTPTFIPTAKPKPYISSKLRTDANMDLVDGKHLDQEIVGPWARTTNWKEFGDEMRGLMKRENLNPTSEADVEKFRKLWIESQNHWFMNNTKPFDKEVTLLNHVLHGSNKYGGKIMEKGGIYDLPNQYGYDIVRKLLHMGRMGHQNYIKGTKPMHGKMQGGGESPPDFSDPRYRGTNPNNYTSKEDRLKARDLLISNIEKDIANGIKYEHANPELIAKGACAFGACTEYEKVGLLKDIYSGNPLFEQNARQNGFGWPNQDYKNFQPGDAQQHFLELDEKTGNPRVSHMQIFLGKTKDGKYRFYDNYRAKDGVPYSGEKSYTDEEMQQFYINNLSPRSYGAAHRVPIVQMDKAPILDPKAKKAIDDRARTAQYNMSAEAEPNYSYSNTDDAKKSPALEKVIKFGNNSTANFNMIKSLSDLKLDEYGSPKEIHEALLRVYGELMQENKGRMAPITGVSPRTAAENAFERIFKPKNKSVGPGQIKFNTIDEDLKKEFGINKPKDLYNWDKVIPLMVAKHIKTRQWMDRQGTDFSARLVGEEGVDVNSTKWSDDDLASYFYRGLGPKNIKKQLHKEIDAIIKTLNVPTDKQEEFRKTYYDDNIRSRQKVMDEGSYADKVKKAWQRDIVRVDNSTEDLESEKDAKVLQEAIITSKVKKKMRGGYMKKGGLTPNKAREILHDGTAQGHPLTDKQRRYFGAMSKGNTMNYRGHKK